MPDWRSEISQRLAPLHLNPEREASIVTELTQHLDQHYDDLMLEGTSENNARETVLAGLDDLNVLRELRNHASGVEPIPAEKPGNQIEILLHDTRYGLRMLRKSPGFTAIAILTMALGIGATTAIFSVVEATLLHPLPYPHPEQLVTIEDDLPGVPAHDVGMSQPEWQDLQHSGIFDYVSPTWYDDNNLTGASRAERVSLLLVAPDYFAVLGVKPQLGRTFDPDSYTSGFTTEVVISDGLWKRAFGADPRILGRNLRLDTDLYHVVGVMPPGFQAPGSTTRDRDIEVWASYSFYGAPLPDKPARSARFLPGAIARLKTGLTITEAQSKLDALVATLQKQFPADYPRQSAWQVRLIPLQQTVVGDIRRSLILLLGAVGLVLLIGCANIANLTLARVGARAREIAVRQALGASGIRLIRQLLTESVLLSLFGGIAGLSVLFCVKGFLLRLLPEAVPRLNNISISWTVLLVALIASAASGVCFGIAPALHAGRLNLIQALKQESRGSTRSGAQLRTRRFLVVTEFALSLTLMIAAGLLLRSFWDLLQEPLGFNPQRVLTIKIRLPYPNDPKNDVYGSASQKNVFFREILRRGRTLPGVEEIAIGDLGALPLGHDRSNQTPPLPIILDDRETVGSEAPLVDNSIVSPEYFRLMGMTLLRGRLFTDLDNENTPEVAVINEAMARTYWPNDDPLGKHFSMSKRSSLTPSRATVIGVVENARTESLEEANTPEIYSSLYQKGAKHLVLFLRGQLDAGILPEQIREQVQDIDATIPVFTPQALSETVSSSMSQRRFSLEVVGLFACTALLLTALGIYGVISYIVSERTHEFGIRLALGAQNGNILSLVLRQGLDLAMVGTVVGLAGAMLISRLMAGVLYGVRSTDPVTFAGVAILLVGVALFACFIPAWRATKVDPMFALREA